MRRIQKLANASAAGLILAALLFGAWGEAVSVVLGALVAMLNFHFLARGVDRALGKPSSRNAVSDALFFVLRLVLIFGTLFVIIQTSFLSLLGALMGLSIYILAGMLEAIFLLAQELRPRR